MKATLTTTLFLFYFSTFSQVDFKKFLENGNMKYNIKSYKLAIEDYDNAIKSVSPEIDKLIESKKPIPENKKYLLEAYIKRASCFYFLGNTAAMKADMEKIAKLDPINKELKSLQSYETFKNGDKINACIALRNEIISGNKLAVQIFDECFCWAEALNLAKESITKNALKKYDEALDMIDRALKILPDSASLHTEKGKILLGKNENEKALTELKLAYSLNKKNYKTCCALASIYIKLDKADTAFDMLTPVINSTKNNFDALYLRAEAAEKMEKWNAAIFDLQQCLIIKPNDGDLYLKIAKIKHDKQNDLLGACEYYKGAHNRGVEEAKEMADNCNNQKYMQKHLKKAED